MDKARVMCANIFLARFSIFLQLLCFISVTKPFLTKGGEEGIILCEKKITGLSDFSALHIDLSSLNASEVGLLPSSLTAGPV